uniref:CNNM transmembrane domain-containing protein n=1 Tax=Fagus sylvatica TaxID=28930 RepID=A0A2N9IN11_FAGSY
MREDSVQCCEPEFWVFLIVCLLLVSLAGITSGLALGLLSFSKVDLEVFIKAGRPQDRKYAAKIMPLVKNEHLLLCTLLVGKSLAMEALPLFLDSILPSWAAILLSVTLVLAFAELLDWLLGKGHSALYRRAELKTLVDMHANKAGKGGDLSHHETTIISGALDLTQKTAKDAMTPIAQTFSLDINLKLDMYTMGLVMSKGHNRIPVYSGSRNNIIGLILVKNLIFCRPEDETPVKYMTIRRIPRVYDNWPLYDILNQFLKGHSHMAVVVKCKKDDKNTENSAVGKHTMLDINMNPKSNQMPAEKKGLYSSLNQKERLSISTNSSPLYFSDTDDRSSTLKNVKEQGKDLNSQNKKWVQGSENTLYENLDLPSNVDEEVVGIITMEDVLEELLQEDIRDETDEYVDVHNKIRINLRSSRRSSSRSPRRSSVSHHYWRTPEPSPLSSYTPILRSPISTYIQPPLVRPILYASPGRSILNSPADSAGVVRSSPSSHRAHVMLEETITFILDRRREDASLIVL